MLKPRATAPVLFALALSSCGGDSNGPTAPTVSIAGRWQGTIESPSDGPGTISLQLTQTGLNVTGPLRLSQSIISDVPGTLTGTLAATSLPTTMQYTVTYEYGTNRCQGVFSGTFNVTSRQIEGPYSGQDCVHAFAGTLRATKSD
jgi:hypothetical protein